MSEQPSEQESSEQVQASSAPSSSSALSGSTATASIPSSAQSAPESSIQSQVESQSIDEDPSLKTEEPSEIPVQQQQQQLDGEQESQQTNSQAVTLPDHQTQIPDDGSAQAVSSQDPQALPATASQGGRELSKTVLYVGNIHKSVSEDVLRDLFSSVGSPIQSMKVLYDKNKQGFNYAFIEYDDNTQAENALRALNSTVLANYPLKITWAYRTQQFRNNDTYTLFVGDLSPEINDDTLTSAFAKFPSFVQANVMWDMKTGRSRGYGFVSFRESQDAEAVLQTMNGASLGGRPIRLNWAVHRSQNQNFPGSMNRVNRGMNAGGLGGMGGISRPPLAPQGAAGSVGAANMPINGMDMLGGAMPANGVNARAPMMQPQSYEMVLRQAPNWLCAVYLGNLAHYTQQSDLIPLLQNFGYIVNFKLLPEKGCAFVTYDSHERAALAIVQLNGFTINGRPLKSGWGRANKTIRPFNN
ncbi:hypothetical protein FOA43_004189 [Brettanomyces nanus]|uniref:RRM domain-containing protein n=1 Tax=Eeniella nana TaxID=13502 RepID=A0A875S9H5_EENNA|nr:uncharacterized protein FOA43_004189 [Brettanomyces nanus]QPG76795.1 hypothetical protein FOA43_004189 [Brettanomyces nanus]